MRLDGSLFFATAEALEDRIRALPKDGDRRRALVLDLEGVNFVDSQGAAKVSEIHRLTEANGVTLRLARLKPRVLAVLQADGVIDRIGPTKSTATSTGRSKRKLRAQACRTNEAEWATRYRCRPRQSAGVRLPVAAALSAG